MAPFAPLQADPGRHETLGQLVLLSGPFAWLAITLACFLLVYGGLMVAVRPPRRAFLVLLLLGTLPLLLGLGGTVAGLRTADVALARERSDPAAPPSPRQAAAHVAGERQAWLAAKVGAVAAAPVLTLALLGLLYPRRRADAEPRPANQG